MKILLGLHHFGIVMWMGGLITTLRLLILHPKESVAVRTRFLYIESGFLQYTALPGILITSISGIFWLYFSLGFNFYTYTPIQLIKIFIFLMMASIHAMVIMQFRSFEILAVEEQNESLVFIIEHKVMLLLTILVLVL